MREARKLQLLYTFSERLGNATYSWHPLTGSYSSTLDLNARRVMASLARTSLERQRPLGAYPGHEALLTPRASKVSRRAVPDRRLALDTCIEGLPVVRSQPSTGRLGAKLVRSGDTVSAIRP